MLLLLQLISFRGIELRNFQLLARGIDVTTLLCELQRQPDLWDENTIRTKHPGTAHSEVSDILIWFNELPMDLGGGYQLKPEIIDDKHVISYRAWKDLPSLRPIVFALMRQVEAVRLGRVIITRLPPGKTISPHTDGGAPVEYYSRYQLAIQCLPGNIFKIGDEQVSFGSGEIWWIDNKKEHSVINNSADDRIVCIIDLRSE